MNFGFTGFGCCGLVWVLDFLISFSGLDLVRVYLDLWFGLVQCGFWSFDCCVFSCVGYELVFCRIPPAGLFVVYGWVGLFVGFAV